MIVVGNRCAFPENGLHDPSVSMNVQVHTKTIMGRNENLTSVADIIVIIATDPDRWRVLFEMFSEDQQRFMDLVDQMRSA